MHGVRTFLAICALALAMPASASEFHLFTDLRSGEEDHFATAMVEEDGAGGLVFEITLDELLFPEHAHIKRLFFNLETDATGLALHSTDPVRRPYKLRDRRHRHRRFDFTVGFGRIHGRRGNGELKTVSFTLSADQPLSIDDLLVPTTTRRGHEVHLAVKVWEGHKRSRHRRPFYWPRFFGGMMQAPEPEEEPPIVVEEPPDSPDPDPADCPFPTYDLITGELVSCY